MRRQPEDLDRIARYYFAPWEPNDDQEALYGDPAFRRSQRAGGIELVFRRELARPLSDRRGLFTNRERLAASYS